MVRKTYWGDKFYETLFSIILLSRIFVITVQWTSSMFLHLLLLITGTSLAFDYTWRDYLLAVNHQIDGTRTDLARRSVANYVHKSLQRDVSTV